MKPIQPDQLEQYILRLYEIQEERKTEVQQEDLKAAAEAVGLTALELEKLEQRSQDQLKRAKSYAKIKRWDDAESEINQALEINYFRVEFLCVAAEICFQKYRAKKRKKDLIKAEINAKKCLDLVPDYQKAQKILFQIDECQKRKNRRKFTWIAVISLVTPCVLLFAWILINETIIRTWPTGMEGQKYSVPIVLGAHPDIKGIDINFSDGNIKHEEYEGSRSFNFNFHTRVSSNAYEVTELGFHALFLDEQGMEVADTYYWFWSEGDMSLRPNEHFYFRDADNWAGDYFHKRAKKVAQVKMKIQGFRKFSGARAYPKPRNLVTKWVALQPEGYDLSVAERFNKVNVLHESDRSTRQELLLEITNSGTKPLRNIELEIEWLDAKEKIIEQQFSKVLYLGEQELKVGEKVVFFLDKNFYEKPWGFPKPFHSYRVNVKSIL